MLYSFHYSDRDLYTRKEYRTKKLMVMASPQKGSNTNNKTLMDLVGLVIQIQGNCFKLIHNNSIVAVFSSPGLNPYIFSYFNVLMFKYNALAIIDPWLKEIGSKTNKKIFQHQD
jgi:hypothetical protein